MSDRAATTRRLGVVIVSGCLTVTVLALCAMTALLATLLQEGGPPPFLAGLLGETAAGDAQVPTIAVAAPTLTPTIPPAATPRPAPTPAFKPPAPPSVDQRPVPPAAHDALAALFNAHYPAHDYYESARRLGRRDLGPRTVNAPRYAVGDRQTFFTDTGTVVAELLAVTDHAYFWVQPELGLDPTAVNAAARTFEEELYPRIVDLFGSEWQPGMDNDPHLSVLHLSIQGELEELGYFISNDEYPQSIDHRSNQQEIIYLNMRYLDLGEPLYYGTLVHELEHLIHWYVDSNEVTWLDEGLAQLAEYHVGLDTVSYDDYLGGARVRLNDWSYDDDERYAHYGAAYLFAVYFREQLGEAAVRELARHPANGLAAVQSVLRGHRPGDSLAQFVGEWLVATYLDDGRAGPRYHYESFELSARRNDFSATTLPLEINPDLDQFSGHTVRVTGGGPITVTFAGDTLADLFPAAPDVAPTWYAPGQNNVDAHLTAAVDLRDVDRATLRFWAWYDLEPDRDFGYVVASTDNGQTWTVLSPAHGMAGEYGRAFSGRSAAAPDAVGGWAPEVIALDAYLGQQVLIRFEMLTDSAISAPGLALNAIAIPELAAPPTWQSNGFVPLAGALPQLWSVTFVDLGPDPTVTPLVLDNYNRVQAAFDTGPAGGLVVITPATPFIDAPATYWLHLDRP